MCETLLHTVLRYAKLRRMKLSEYISERGNGATLALALGVPHSSITNWATGARQIPAARCPDIERATNGVVTCEELRPDLSEQWAYLRNSNQQQAA